MDYLEKDDPDGSPAIFWSIAVSAYSTHLRCGRVGAPQNKIHKATKVHADVADAQKYATNLVAEKITQGFEHREPPNYAYVGLDRHEMVLVLAFRALADKYLAGNPT